VGCTVDDAAVGAAEGRADGFAVGAAVVGVAVGPAVVGTVVGLADGAVIAVMVTDPAIPSEAARLYTNPLENVIPAADP